MKLKELIEKLSSATEEEMNMEVIVFDIHTGKHFYPGKGRTSPSDFGNSNAGWIQSKEYHITIDSK